VITVSRAVVHLRAKERTDHERFVVKQYPKDRERRRVSITAELAGKLRRYMSERGLGSDDLLFQQPRPEGPAQCHVA
jgi:integrase